VDPDPDPAFFLIVAPHLDPDPNADPDPVPDPGFYDQQFEEIYS
jgi:hypothetical protein